MSRTAKRSGLLLVSAFLLAGGFSAAHAAIPATERAALIALYDHSNGDGWYDNTGWKTPPLAGDGFAMPGTECDWVSVWCDGVETTVQEIDLQFNGLSGSIPPELENLTNLEYLFLSYNQLSGSIPSALGNLGKLVFLYLDHNDLSGGIPPGLGSIGTLLELSLYTNDLTGSIPPELGDLANLEILWLDNNDLTGSIPPELGDLANVRFFFLFNNQLSGGIPAELENLASVEALFLNGNQLTGSIPPELGYLGVLLNIYLNDNELVGPVPVEMMDLTSLLDDRSNFCNNHLYTNDAALSSFLDTKQKGGDWQSCQTPYTPVPAVPNAGMLLLFALLAGSALWAVGRTATTTG
jgi:hypothetical protein